MGSIHIKLEYPEAVLIKRDVLLIEKDLLETSKYIKNYTSLRKKEFILKVKLKKDFEILGNLISSIESSLPREEAEIASRKGGELSKTNIKKEKALSVEKKKSTIESQIDDIRAKLAELG